MFMLMMLMMMKLEQVPTFLLKHSDPHINCELHRVPRTSLSVLLPHWIGSFAECSVEDKPVDRMPNVTRVSLEDNAFY